MAMAGYTIAVVTSMIGMCAMDSENLAYPIGIIATGMLIGLITRLAERVREDRDADYVAVIDR